MSKKKSLDKTTERRKEGNIKIKQERNERKEEKKYKPREESSLLEDKIKAARSWSINCPQAISMSVKFWKSTTSVWMNRLTSKAAGRGLPRTPSVRGESTPSGNSHKHELHLLCLLAWVRAWLRVCVCWQSTTYLKIPFRARKAIHKRMGRSIKCVCVVLKKGTLIR